MLTDAWMTPILQLGDWTTKLMRKHVAIRLYISGAVVRIWSAVPFSFSKFLAWLLMPPDTFSMTIKSWSNYVQHGYHRLSLAPVPHMLESSRSVGAEPRHIVPCKSLLFIYGPGITEHLLGPTLEGTAKVLSSITLQPADVASVFVTHRGWRIASGSGVEYDASYLVLAFALWNPLGERKSY
ncbi:hypothetical protein K432DRAFT_387983 [Lepidopterella palustris CBS 459.81]|uniref:Uncharacterized protein n=1 Tax=Lepidopterella palustris CBS 459.81 TaxID=1314670 RepID=A0A8E2ELT3_9PEZI|nr:hypothetical protein K432DRAFT_387983 [Lepidopterella palustris CBS 459.81]